MRSVLSLAALCSLLSVGCGIFVEPAPDGSACEYHEDCESEQCYGGLCTFSSCNNDGDCEAGFTCDEPPNWVEILSLGTADGTCRPGCDVCPFRVEPRWICSEASDRCSYDGEPWVEAGGPYEGMVGEPVRLEGSAEVVERREVEEYRWEQGTEVLGSGASIEVRFEEPGNHRVTLVVTDSSERIGIAEAEVRVCAHEGGTCGSSNDCCGLECRDDDGDGEGSCMQPAVCGNGVIEGAEDCDGGLVPELDCADQGDYHPGTVPCGTDCRPDLDGCQRCGTSFDDCRSDADCCEGWSCDLDQLYCRSS